MTKVDKNTIREALRKVIDPELNASVVDLNMIREIDITKKGKVTIHLVLTAPGCPLKDWISQQIYNEDISKELPLGRTTVNQHLNELKRAGLVMGIVSGSRTNYCLNPEKIKELRSAAENFFNVIDIDEEIEC